MTADSELFLTETVEQMLKQKIRTLIPRDRNIYLRDPPDWCGHWDSSVFPTRGKAEVFLNRFGHLELFGTVSWETNFTVAEYGGPARAIEACAVNVRFRKFR